MVALFVASPLYAGERMTREQACRTVDRYGDNPITGIWRMGGDGATIAILPVRGKTETFDIYMLDSPDMSIIPGGKTGSLRTTGETAVYDAEFKTKKFLRDKTFRFILTLGKDGILTFKSYRRDKTVSLWRLLPYMFRYTVQSHDTRPGAVDGAYKIYPSVMPSGPTLL